jgi:hypothetical protein
MALGFERWLRFAHEYLKRTIPQTSSLRILRTTGPQLITVAVFRPSILRVWDT